MASKTITITEDVYQLLKSLKKQDESFSELLRRLAMQVNGQKLEAFFGLWDINDQEYKEIQEEIKRNLIPFNGKKR
ncbi:MAG: antitoxin VapB family protein, partial [Promethearchaeota archaeon]